MFGLLNSFAPGARDVLLPAAPSFGAAGAKDGFVVRDIEAAGGPIDVRFVAVSPGLVVVVVGARAFDVVRVRDVEAEEVPDDNCFVGDFVGD